MNYFEELLSSYQKMKKREFRVSMHIKEQGQDPMAAYADAANRATALGSRGVIPIDQGEKLGVNGVITAYTSKTKDGIVPGLAMSDKKTPIPGSQNYAVRISTIASNKEVQNKIGQILLGQQAETTPDDAQLDTGAEDQQPQEQIPQVTSPDQMQEMEYQTGLGKCLDVCKALIGGNFFQSLFGEDGEYAKNKDGSTRIPNWDRIDSLALQDLFISDESQSLKTKLDNSITGNDVPLDLKQKLEITRTMEKFLKIAGKVKDGTASFDEVKWIGEHMQTGLSYSDKRTLRIKSDESDAVATFSWSGGQGIRKDTQIWKHLIDSTNMAVQNWAKNQVPQIDPKDLGIQKVALTEVVVTTGMLNNIRGVFAEKWIPLSTLLLKAQTTTDPKKSTEYKLEAIKIFSDVWEKNGDSLLKAFNAYEAYVGEGVAVDDATLGQLLEFRELAKTFNIAVNESSIKGMTPEQKKKLSDVFTMTIAKSLISLDSQFSLKLGSDYVATTGEKDVNGKKTDVVFMFESREKAIDGLRRAGVPDADIEQVLLDGVAAGALYGDDVAQFSDRLSQGGKSPVAAFVGIKTYLKAKGVTMGTGSITSVFDTLSNRATTQANKIRTSLQDRFGRSAYKDHTEKMAQLQTTQAEISKLKWSGRGEINKATLSKIKSVLGKDSEEFRELVDRIDNYKEGEDKKLKYDVNKVLDDHYKNILLKDIKSGLKSSDKAKRKSALCTLTGFLKSTGSAEEQNQLTVVRYMKENESNTINHNDSLNQLINGLEDDSLTLDYSANGFAIRTNCRGKRVCDEDHYASLNISEGKFELEYTLNNVRRNNKQPKTSVNASTDLIVNFLIGQKNLLEQLLSRYQ